MNFYFLGDGEQPVDDAVEVEHDVAVEFVNGFASSGPCTTPLASRRVAWLTTFYDSASTLTRMTTI